MRQVRIPAAFMRGGTSNAVVFHQRDLPVDRSEWVEIFLAAMGSPDSTGRQLDGMGGGVSSLSKVCVVGSSSHPDADVDYTFAQVSIKDASVDFRPNCGNMSSAIGPFAVDEGYVRTYGDKALVRIHNTNTRKIIHSHFAVDGGAAAVDGDFSIPGVSGTGAPIRLDFLQPGGSATGRLLPTGNVVDWFQVPGIGDVEASIVDAANGCVFVRASAFGLKGTEMPDRLEALPELIEKLECVRTQAAIAMGLVRRADDFRNKTTLIPMIGLMSGPEDYRTISGDLIKAERSDVTTRMFSMGGWPHRAMPLTSSLCMAVAARVEGTVVHQCARDTGNPEADVRMAMPSGILVVGAKVRRDHGRWHAESVSVYRTARRMFDGHLLVRASRVPGLAVVRRRKAAA